MVPPYPHPLAWAPPAPAPVFVGRLPPTGAAHPTAAAFWSGGARCPSGLLPPSYSGGGGGAEPLGTFPVTPGARGSRSAAAAAPVAIPPPPHPGVGPLPPPLRPEGTQGHRLAPGRPRGLWAYRHPPAGQGVRSLGRPKRGGGGAGGGPAAITTTTSPRRDRHGAKGSIRGATPPPPPVFTRLSAEACPARQCPVASEMAWQAQAILGGRGVQTQATAAVAAPPPTLRDASLQALQREISRSLRLDSQRSDGARTLPHARQLAVWRSPHSPWAGQPAIWRGPHSPP